MTVSVPALRGDDPLGFLAALGLVALAEQGELPSLRLAWEGRHAPNAVIDGDFDSLDSLGEALEKTFRSLRERGELAPGFGTDFPPQQTGTTDPMRMSPGKMAELYQRADEMWHDGQPWFARWLIALTGQATVKDAKRGDVALTPFYAPTGRMTLRGSIFEKTIEAVEQVDGPGDAVRRWRRISYYGANFDDRAERDAGVTTTGKPDSQGAPSPTWLAAMAMRLFPMTDDGRKTSAVGWQRARMFQGFTSRSLVWPVWRPFLDAAAVRTLLARPELELESGEVQDSNVARLAALGVTGVFGSSRRTLSQGDGPLGPARHLWPSS